MRMPEDHNGQAYVVVHFDDLMCFRRMMKVNSRCQQLSQIRTNDIK